MTMTISGTSFAQAGRNRYGTSNSPSYKKTLPMKNLSVHPAVMADYGFINCRDDSERRQLKRVYKAFFDTPDGDPLALHEAAIKGNIHGYISKVRRAGSSRAQVPAAHERPVPSSGLVTSYLTIIPCPGLLL
ncbi:hypothetical protein HD554DRAFT_1023623 [Boletus coccyginus]|nr:hypothetical protein HD554DRAFT_1023623 [Boletus coccyginus]